MFAPLVTTTGDIVFVAPSHIKRMEAGPELPPESGLAPDGKPWPTTIIWWGPNECISVKGTPVMILNAWFGAQHEPERPKSNILTVPPGTRVRN